MNNIKTLLKILEQNQTKPIYFFTVSPRGLVQKAWVYTAVDSESTVEGFVTSEPPVLGKLPPVLSANASLVRYLDYVFPVTNHRHRARMMLGNFLEGRLVYLRRSVADRFTKYQFAK